MIYFTSDLHFCHANIIKMNNRPFANVDEMNATLINNWNSVVTSRDEIFILGDFLYRGSGAQANDILRNLHGKKYLIKGNHEKYLNDRDFDRSAFEWIRDYFVLEYKDAQFVLFHYPILEWANYYRKSAHLFGHVHNNDFKHPEARAINVGSDVNNFHPVSVDATYAKAFANYERRKFAL